MSEPINGVVKRIEDFRNKLVQHDADREVIKELDVLSTFLNEVVIKSLHYEHELWEEKVKLKEERSQMLEAELEEKRKDIASLLAEREKKVKELEWEVEKIEKEFAETSKNYKDRLAILSDENKVLGERIYQKEIESRNLQAKKDQELNIISEEIAAIEEEMKKLAKERQALKDELEKEKARSEELSRELTDINKRYFEKIRMVNEENLLQQEKNERQYVLDLAKHRLKYEQELKNLKEEYGKLEERSRENEERYEKERKKLIIENLKLKKAEENNAERGSADSIELNSMISEMNAKIVYLKNENERIKKEKADIENGLESARAVKNTARNAVETKDAEKISADEILAKSEDLRKNMEKEIAKVKEELNLF